MTVQFTFDNISITPVENEETLILQNFGRPACFNFLPLFVLLLLHILIGPIYLIGQGVELLMTRRQQGEESNKLHF